MEVNVQEDLNAVNDQLQKLVEELNKVSAARENIIQQVQNLNGVAMYLRGKLPSDEQTENPLVTPPVVESGEEFERDTEYPPDNA
jgi:hypothetical protein